jgi:hypothetical protein
MTTQRTLAWQTAWAVFATALTSAAWAGSVSGRIAFPGRTPPAVTVYVRGLDGLTLHHQALKRGEVEYSLEVPAGRYWIFARPDEPGLAGLYGAHTLFSLCNRAGTDDSPECSDHALAAIDVPAAGVMSVNVDDWMLSDETATELDGILGAVPAAPDSAELGRPRFSEYRVPRSADHPAAALDLASEPRAAPFAAQLEEALLRGGNFAGHFTLVRVACGEHCARVVIVDRTNGAITLPEALAQGLGRLPCRADGELDFREDSRLIEATRLETETVVTDYLLWDAELRKLAPVAQYRRSLERFCDGAK